MGFESDARHDRVSVCARPPRVAIGQPESAAVNDDTSFGHERFAVKQALFVAPREEAADLRCAIPGRHWLALGCAATGKAGAGHRSQQKLATIHRLSRETPGFAEVARPGQSGLNGVSAPERLYRAPRLGAVSCTGDRTPAR